MFKCQVAWKRGAPKQNFDLKIYPHHPLYHIPLPKSQKRVFCTEKVIKSSEAPEGLYMDRVVFSFHSNRVFFRFIIDRILFRVLSGRVFFKSSVIGFSSVFAVIDFHLGSSVLFFRYVAIFASNHGTTFLSKTYVLFYIIFSNRSSHLTI